MDLLVRVGALLVEALACAGLGLLFLTGCLYAAG